MQVPYIECFMFLINTSTSIYHITTCGRCHETKNKRCRITFLFKECLGVYLFIYNHFIHIGLFAHDAMYENLFCSFSI